MLKDIKSKLTVNNIKLPKNMKQATNYSLDKRKKSSEQTTKVLIQNSSNSDKIKLDKQITFSPVSMNISKVAYTTKQNNSIYKNPHYSAKVFEKKNESMSRERDMVKKNSSQYNANILWTEANLKNIIKNDNNINNSNYINLLTENCFSAKSKISKNRTIYSENKGLNDVNTKNFSPKNILKYSKQTESNKKSIFDYKIKPHSIKLSKPGGSSQSPTKKLKKEVSISQESNCFKIEKFDEIKSKILKFCTNNNMTINEVNMCFIIN